MKYVTKTILISCIVAATLLNGCSKTKEIKVSEDVKNETLVRAEDNKIRSEPVLKKKLDGLENQHILSWIDDENILTTNTKAFSLKDRQVILYSYNLESGESTEILNDSNIEHICGYDDSGVVLLLGRDKKVFVYDIKEGKLEEVLDFEKEFGDGIPGMKIPKDEQYSFFYGGLHLIKRDYIFYPKRVNPETFKGKSEIEEAKETSEYTILNYKENKKYTIGSSISRSGTGGKFDLTGKNIYKEDLDKITKLNLETGEESTMKLSEPRILSVCEDGTLFVERMEEDENGDYTRKWYKVDFDNKEITKYDTNYESKNLYMDVVDFKNQFVGLTNLGEGKNGEKNMVMYGKLEGNKIVVKDKLFKNNEDYGCNTAKSFIFSPDHNKFIAGVQIRKWEDDSSDSPSSVTDTEYLFELK